MSFQRELNEDNSRIKRWSQLNILSPNRMLIIYAKLSRKYNLKKKMSTNGKKRGSTRVSPAKLEIQKAVPN